MDISGSLFKHQMNENFAFYSPPLALASNLKRLFLCRVQALAVPGVSVINEKGARLLFTTGCAKD